MFRLQLYACISACILGFSQGHQALIRTQVARLTQPYKKIPDVVIADAGKAGKESLVEEQDALQHLRKADQVRDALQHLWNGYKAGAWGQDEVRPISGRPGNKWGNVGMEILDTMDTLWLAGLHKEFNEGKEWLRQNFTLQGKSNGYHTSFFETTIRGLGGLLSCYALTNESIFREKAQELGSTLLTAFPKGDDDQKWPAALIDLRNPADQEAVPKWLNKIILADAGSNLLEFTYLSKVVGAAKYEEAAHANEAHLLDLAEREHRHFVPKFLRAGQYGSATGEVSAGAFADSYFEYLLKGYLQSGKKDMRLLNEWKQAMQEMREQILHTNDAGYTFLAQAPGGHVMQHLSCFMGGLLALGSYSVPEEHREDWWLPTGKEITRTCYEMYRQSPSGLSAEESIIEGTSVRPRETQASFRIRPETLESLFYLYRITGDEKYREWSANIFDHINMHARTQFGIANVKDVRNVPVTLTDSEETFVGAETLKYALLIQLPPEVLPLDKYVLNTEAHPLPILQDVTPI